MVMVMMVVMVVMMTPAMVVKVVVTNLGRHLGKPHCITGRRLG
jgi:hypothetical protein